MSLETFLSKLTLDPTAIDFSETIAVIDENFIFTPTAFKNGELKNEAGQNSGSCKILSFARHFNLSKDQTLNCFGKYYRVEVLANPDAHDHQNIRNFMKYGLEGLRFDGEALQPR